MIVQIGEYISEGSKEFLFEEYKYLAVFILIFGIIILIAVDCYG